MLYEMGYVRCEKWARKFYKNIGRINCPALNNEYVAFNNTGFNHLIRKQRIRSRTVQKQRFLLLPHAEKILKNPKALIEYRQEEKKIIVKREGEKVLQGTLIQHWTFIQEVKERRGRFRVKVVVRQAGNGLKHFYSIMGDKIKNKKPLN